jgi:hypothetical protein
MIPFSSTQGRDHELIDLGHSSFGKHWLTLRLLKPQVVHLRAAKRASSQGAKGVGRITVTREQIRAQLKNTRAEPFKAPGPDGVPNIVLRNCADTIVDRLYYIFEAMLERGFLYKPWKVSNTVVLRKPGKPRSSPHPPHASGKSVLWFVTPHWHCHCCCLFELNYRSSGIIEDITAEHEAGLVIVAYFYCDFRDDDKQNCCDLCCSKSTATTSGSSSGGGGGGGGGRLYALSLSTSIDGHTEFVLVAWSSFSPPTLAKDCEQYFGPRGTADVRLECEWDAGDDLEMERHVLPNFAHEMAEDVVRRHRMLAHHKPLATYVCSA